MVVKKLVKVNAIYEVLNIRFAKNTQVEQTSVLCR